MQARVRNIINQLQVLIISDNAEFTYRITKQADLAAYNAILTTPQDAAQHLLEHVRPQVIIAIDDSDSTQELFQALATDSEIESRPILIIVSDDPSGDLF